MVNTSDYEKTIEHQFDSFCKKVLRNRVRTIHSENKRKNDILVSLEALSTKELNQLYCYDNYDSEYSHLSTFDYTIPIENVFIAHAIESLPQKQQDIILLSYFLGMKDVDIASLMEIANSTVHYQKEKAMKNLKKFMEGNIDE